MLEAKIIKNRTSRQENREANQDEQEINVVVRLYIP